MIVVMAIAALAIAYRIKARLFTKSEAVILAIFAVNWLMIELQIVICDHRTHPEMRYWVQAGILLSGWAVWAVHKVSISLAEKIRPAKYVLPLIVVCLAITETVMIAKAHIPVGRRYAYVQVVDWAKDLIKADWRGPEKDEGIEYFNGEYRQPNRPIISCHTARLPYVLNGRNDSVSGYFENDTPDCICDEEKNINLSSPALHGACYELMDKCEVGKRRFALYRRAGKESAK